MSSELVLRRQHYEGPFAVIAQIKNADRLLCLNATAEQRGLRRGMGLADARSFCPELQTVEHRSQADAAFQNSLVRWAKRYCPWVGKNGIDGLSLDVTGSAHLFGGEDAMLHDMHGHWHGLVKVAQRWERHAKPSAHCLSPVFGSLPKRTRRYSGWALRPLGNSLIYHGQQLVNGSGPLC
jgi:protein ImuB